MEDLRDRELVEEAIELLPTLVRLLKTTLCLPTEVNVVPFGQIRVLLFLYHNGRSSVGHVAAGIGVSLATASELVDRLVDEGWLERGVNPADRRQVHLWLTPKAIELNDSIHDMRRAQLSEAMSRLTPDDRRAFVHGLRSLIDVLAESAASSTVPITE